MDKRELQTFMKENKITQKDVESKVSKFMDEMSGDFLVEFHVEDFNNIQELENKSIFFVGQQVIKRMKEQSQSFSLVRMSLSSNIIS